MEFTDKSCMCIACGREFLFSASEQQFYLTKGFQHSPKHCTECRRKQGRKTRKLNETEVTCASCGARTTVPFAPHNGKPVLCLSCFQKKRNTAPSSGVISLPAES